RARRVPGDAVRVADHRRGARQSGEPVSGLTVRLDMGQPMTAVLTETKLSRETQLVREAAEWMDEEYPGWEDRVNPGPLDILLPCRCIIGEIGGEGEYSKRYMRGDLDRFTCGNTGASFSPFASREAEPFWQDEIGRRLGSKVAA